MADLLANAHRRRLHAAPVTGGWPVRARCHHGDGCSVVRVTPPTPAFSGTILVVYRVSDGAVRATSARSRSPSHRWQMLPSRSNDTFSAAIDGFLPVAQSATTLVANRHRRGRHRRLVVTSVGNAVGGTVSLPRDGDVHADRLTSTARRRSSTPSATAPLTHRRGDVPAPLDAPRGDRHARQPGCSPTVTIAIATLLSNDTDPDGTRSRSWASRATQPTGRSRSSGRTSCSPRRPSGSVASSTPSTDDDGLTASATVLFSAVTP